MRLQSNGDKMLITHKAQVDGYKPHVWFNKTYITNLIVLKNIINRYRVTYNSLDEMFIVHREQHGKHNIHFKMHDSGINFYDP